ncbi:MAG: hypothetical protein RLZZ210_1751, partial [Pseudomonadota bacterium]
MRIVIDMQGAQTENKFRGIGKYIMSLIKEFLLINQKDEIILVL